MGMPELPWDKLFETMFLLFLDNPHAKELALKPACENLLGMPPEERDAVGDWLFEHESELHAYGLLPSDVSLSRDKKAKPSKSGWPQYFSAWVCLAPGDIAGKYANGDTIRTGKLFDKLMPEIKKRKMMEAYDRERKLIPILIEIERQGIRVDLQRLEHDVQMYDQCMIDSEKWLRKKMKVGADFNINADQQVVRAMADAGLIDLDRLGATPKSKPEKITYKSDADSIANAVIDKVFAGVLKYRNQLTTCLNTFMKPWLKVAQKSGGLIFTHWNQIRSEKAGARTGRFSSSPNFQNIPTMFKHIFKHTALRAADACEEKDEQVKLLALAKTLPALPKGMPLTDLPLCRSYIIPYLPGHLLVDRDFSQQEPRIFAHFEDGPLTAAYNENPWLDLHDHASDEIFKLLGKRFPRKKTKIINLGLLYGKGIKLLASEIDDTEDVAKELKNAVLKIFPGLAEMNKTMKERARNNLPIRTWGGREYYCEPPKMVDGRMMTFDYKLINVVVQGSAADYTKEALIEYWETKEIETYFLIMVHDEFLSSTPQRMAIHAMNTMRDAMDSTTRLDVPMLSEGTVSNGNWAAMTNWDKKGVVVYDKEKDSCCIFGRSSSRM
jgi:DNA polymerase-1